MSEPPPPAPPHRDRTLRLTLFGVLNLLLAAGLVALAAFYVAVPLTGLLPERSGVTIDLRSAAAAAATYLVLAGILVWSGWGALRQRRWVRPVMLTLAWTWLLCGVLLVPLTWWMVDAMLREPSADFGDPLPPELGLAVRGFVLIGATLGGVVLPLLYLVAFRDRHLLDTCRARHPRPDWSDDCPGSVLGLALGLAAAGLLSLPLALQPAVPLFGYVATGWPGALATLVGAAACLALVRPVVARTALGWWGALALLALLGISCAVTFGAGRGAALLGSLGGTEQLPGGLAPELRAAGVWGSLAITLLSVSYLLAVRRHFFRVGH